VLYERDFARLLRLAGLASATGPSEQARRRTIGALCARDGLSPREHAETMAFGAEVRARRDRR